MDNRRSIRSWCSAVFLLLRKEPDNKEEALNIEYTVSGLIALLLLFYLMYALLKPEKF
jgi:K+-transporting ATPase KdpF subunit